MAHSVRTKKLIFQFQVKEQESLIQSTKEAASRVTSLNPSASFYVRDRNNSSSNGNATARSGYMPMRSASMRETSYSRSIRRSRLVVSYHEHNCWPNGCAF